jgi:hypothetical protein
MVPLLGLVLFSATLALIPTRHASALAIDEVNKQLEDEYKAWGSFNFISYCMSTAFPDTLNKSDYGDSPTGDGTVGDVGDIIKPGDGGFSCDSADDLKIALPLIGFDSIREFNNTYYPITVKNCDGDDCKSIPIKDMRDKIQDRIRGKDWTGPDGAVNTLSPQAQYWWYQHYAFGQCGGSPFEKADDPGYLKASQSKKNEASDEKISAWILDEDDPTKIVERKYWTFTKEDDDGFEQLGWKLDTNPYSVKAGLGQEALDCIDMANGLHKANAALYADMFRQAIKDCVAAGQSEEVCLGQAKDNADPNKVQTGPPGTVSDSCESQSGVMGFIMCPVIDLVGGALNWVDTQLSRLMQVDRDRYGSGPNSEKLYSAWASFRNIGLTLLIAAMLVMVISTALGIGALDAYTVKKAFPRMVASVVFMLLSWYVCVFLIDATNVIGKGVLGLMTSPFGLSSGSLAALFSTDTGGAVVQGGAVLALTGSLFAIPGAAGIILSWIGTGLLVMAIAFIVLVARQMFIIVLILLSPLAILAWIFPGNDKLWKFWWESFSKLLLMFPMVMALIGAGRIFANVLANTDAAGGQSLIDSLMKLTAYILPYAFIPFTFKAAGGIFGNLAGMVNDRSRGAFDRLKKGRQKGLHDIGQRMGAGQGFRGKQSNVLNRGSSRLASGPRGWVSGSKARAIQQGKLRNLGAEQVKDNAMYNAYKNDEKFLLAAANEKMAMDAIRRAQNELDTGIDAGDGHALSAEEKAGKRQEVLARQAALQAARSIPNRNAAFRRQAALDLAATGYEIAGGKEGWEQLKTIAADVSGGDKAAEADFMNNAQFALKGAGRFDQAGINNGAYYDADTGVGKASLYELANGKKQSIEAMVRPGMTQKQQAVALSELKAMLPNAKGANVKTINKQIAALEADPALDAYMKTATGQQTQRRIDFVAERADPTSPSYDAAYAAQWSDPTDRARGWRTEIRNETNADVAQKEARTYERPDPNNIT